jgi:alkylhydroperoxidase/carboxymuconolactone decarboxylase family protein YurZ
MHSIDNLKKLSRFGKLAPEATNAFCAYDKAALADGAISKKYKELMAIAALSPRSVSTASAGSH